MNSCSLSCALITSAREDHMQASGGREIALGDENTACLSGFVWETAKEIII